MKEALDNIFRKQEPVRRYVKIVKRLKGNRYQTIDVYGRLFNVDSDDDWKTGEYVKIQNARIVSRTGVIETPTQYQG